MRTRSAILHNTIANHPEVAASLGWNPVDHPETSGYMLFDHLANDDKTFLLHSGEREITAEDMLDVRVPLPAVAMIFQWSAPHVYEAHTLAHPDRREHSLSEAKALIHEMLMQHGAEMIWGQAATANVRACKFFHKVGAVEMGEGHNPLIGPVTYFAGYKEAWLRDHWPRPE